MQVRISDAEYRKQKEKSKAAGLTVSEFLRQQAKGLNARSKRPRGTGSIFSVPGSKNLEKVIVDELYDDLLRHYGIHGQDEEWAKVRWQVRLKYYFGGMRASRIGTSQIAEYAERRQGQGAAKATINRREPPGQRDPLTCAM